MLDTCYQHLDNQGFSSSMYDANVCTITCLSYHTLSLHSQLNPILTSPRLRQLVVQLILLSDRIPVHCRLSHSSPLCFPESLLMPFALLGRWWLYKSTMSSATIFLVLPLEPFASEVSAVAPRHHVLYPLITWEQAHVSAATRAFLSPKERPIPWKKRAGESIARCRPQQTSPRLVSNLPAGEEMR